MKTVIWCTSFFVCGLLGGVLYSYSPLFLPAGSSPAFSLWQEASAEVRMDPKVREKLLLMMAQSDAPHAWQVLMKNGEKPCMSEIEQVAREWGWQDGRGAAAFGQAIADPIERHAFLTVALACWFGNQPQVFLEWLKTQAERERIVADMSYMEYGKIIKPEVASLDALMALYAGSQGPQAQLGSLVSHVWQHGGQKEEVMAWLRRQPESEQRDYAWNAIAKDLAPTDARAAAALAVEVASPKIRRSLTSTAAAWMAKADASAALAYAESLPDDESRNAAWHSVLGTWLMNDPAGALGYVRQHHDTITTDKVQPVLGSEPAVAADVLGLVRLMKGSEESRDALLSSIMSAWKEYSREDMRRWLASPEAAWMPPKSLKRYQQMAEQPWSFSGGNQTIQGRRVWISS
ncbi:MAG: hypothetical protein ACYC67_11205 [Prosthecobacter sp.]